MDCRTFRNMCFREAAACALLCVALDVSGAPSYRADRNYPDLGLRIRVLGDSVPEPLAQVKTYTYTHTRGQERFKLDKFDPFELWYASQHAGQWRDEAGNLLILGHPTHQLPSFEGKHVTREAFDRAMERPACAFDPESAEAVTAWVAAFSKRTPGKPESLRPPSLNVANAVFFPVEEPSALVYAFRVKTRSRYGQIELSDWFCVVVLIGDGTAEAKARKDFEAQFLGNVGAIPRNAPAGGGVQAKAIVTDSNRVGASVIHDHPSRTAARKSIANMKDWWYAETPEYIFLSDIRSSTGRRLVKELQTDMPALRGAFAALIPPFQPSGDVGVVRIYEDADTYKQYVGKDHAWSSGVWMPMSRELVILSQGQDREGTLSIIRHEGFHQYLFYACNMIETSPWFNEGHACFFEVAEVDRQGRVDIPENERSQHLMRNLEIVTRQIPELLSAGYEGFYRGTDEQRMLNYTAAWALVYYLWKGAPLDPRNPYAAVVGDYLAALSETRDSRKATAVAFEKLDMPKFQKDFGDFWKRRRAAARRVDPIAAAVKRSSASQP